MRTVPSEAVLPQYPSLSRLSDSDLLRRAHEIALEERKAGIALLHHLCEIERRRLYAARFGSLHEYVVRELGYSDGAAHRRISAMRLMKVAPEVEQKLEQGKLTLSTASQIQNFLKTEKRVTGVAAPPSKIRSILTEVEGKSSRQTEAYFANRSPQVAELMRERPRSIVGEKVQVNVVLSASLQEKLKRLRDRLSHQNTSPTLAEQIELLADFALRKLEGHSEKSRISESREVSTPLASAHRQVEMPTTPSSTAPVKMRPAISPQISGVVREATQSDDGTHIPNRMRALPTRSRYISTTTQREVWCRAEARCEQIFSNGERCSRTHLLQIDHRFPVAWGGGNELSNLQLLCAVHNQVKSDRLPSE